MSQLVKQETLRKLQRMEDASSLHVNAFEKSLRTYSTKLHPILKERLVTLGSIQDDVSSLSSSSSYMFSETQEGMNGRTFSNYVLQPLFDHEEPEFHDIIYAVCSKKTTGPEGFGSQTMDRIVEKALRTEASKHSDRPMELRDLCLGELGYEKTQDLLQDDYKQSSLCIAINSFLESHNWSFPASEFLDLPSRCLPPLLEMDSKFYPTRNDDRAFCKDRCLLRHVTGCCLHQLFHPRNISVRQELQRNAVLPAKGKDTLDFTIPRLKGRTSRVTLSDISNFTGSAGNSWAMLHALALQLSCGGTWDKLPNVFCVKGSFLSATWRDLMIIYLYHVVGVPCSVPGRMADGYLPGGFLGVAANITIGLVFLSVVLENLKRILRKDLDYVQCQAGGDDNVFFMVGELNDVEIKTDLVRNSLETYVGHIKEFTVIDLEEWPDGVLTGVRFCKKMVVKTTEGNCFRIRTLPSIPIPESLSSFTSLNTVEAQLEGWRSLHLGLKRFENDYPGDTRVIADTVRARFIELHPECYPPREYQTHRVWHPSLKWVVTNGVKISEKALKILSTYSDVTNGQLVYLDSLTERIRHALMLGHVRRQSAQMGGLDTEIFVSPNESNTVITTRTYQHVGLEIDRELLEQIRLIYL